jgi:hypothetical protein
MDSANGSCAVLMPSAQNFANGFVSISGTLGSLAADFGVTLVANWYILQIYLPISIPISLTSYAA